MKIGILAAGDTPPALKSDFGSYAQMLMNLLRRAESSLEFEVFEVEHGIFPDSPSICDAWAITGSRHNVDDDYDWIKQLRSFILAVKESQRPLVGICFGHQIIAQVMGANVGAAPNGWGLGVHTYRLDDPKLQSALGETLSLNAVHQYQVLSQPKDSSVVASSEFCPFAALKYGDDMASFQAHPEFLTRFERSLLEHKKGEPFPETLTDQQLMSLDEKTDAQANVVGRWLADFLHRNAS
jgi:GMP synthase-like glutamine amidotransferase